MNSTRATPKLTYAHYVLFPEDGRRHEILDGEHVVNPAPTPRHQAIAGKLYRLLCEQIEDRGLGRVFVSPIDVELSPHDIVQPDLVVVLNEHREIIIPSRIQGTPDLVVEVLSDSTGQLDLVLKKATYQRAGVPEYWIVDPQQEQIEQYVLSAEGVYQLQQRAGETLAACCIPGLSVDANALWRNAAGL